MARRRPKRFADQPIDPRSRIVVNAQHLSGRTYSLTLECGHIIRRRFCGAPQRVVCTSCPPAGGIGQMR